LRLRLVEVSIGILRAPPNEHLRRQEYGWLSGLVKTQISRFQKMKLRVKQLILVDFWTKVGVSERHSGAQERQQIHVRPRP
jgi:hypothetical protein